MPTVNRTTSTPVGYVIATMQSQINAMVTSMTAGTSILAADIVALVSIYNSLATHYHTASDLRGVDTYGNYGVYGAGLYVTSTSYPPSTSIVSTPTSFSTATQGAGPADIRFKPDGTAMYIVSTADYIVQYALGTPWNVTTAVYVTSFSVTAQDTVPNGVAFKPDGTAMYVSGGTNDNITQYTLSTPWNVSTATYVSYRACASQDTGISDVTFKPDGTIMYVSGKTNDAVYQYNLGTAWDVTTAIYTSQKSVAAQDSNITGLELSSDGVNLYITGGLGDAVYQYTLSTPWNVTTATFVSSRAIPQDTTPNGVAFNSTGTVMYVGGNDTSAVYQYPLSSSWNIVTGDYVLTHTPGVLPAGVAANSEVTAADINAIIAFINTMTTHAHALTDVTS